MKIKKTPAIFDKVEEIATKRQILNKITKPLVDFFNFVDLNSYMNLEKLKEDIKNMEEDELKQHISAFLGLLYFANSTGQTEIDDDDEDMLEIISNQIYHKLTIYKKDFFQENLYYKNIKIPDVTIGSCSLTNEYFDFGSTLIDNEKQTDDILEDPSIGFFVDKIGYPCIKEKDEVWMSITPNEINTMKNSIENVSGNVLVLGLGLGYYPYMISMKDNVSGITIIENNEDIIELFTQYILPQFEHKEKIKIIKQDAFEYLSSLADGQFDFCFADLWFSVNDGTALYLKLKVYQKKFRKTKFYYWIENALLDSLMFYVHLETIASVLPVKDFFELEDIDEDYKFIRKLLKNEKIETPTDIDLLLKKNALRSLITKNAKKILNYSLS